MGKQLMSLRLSAIVFLFQTAHNPAPAVTLAAVAAAAARDDDEGRTPSFSLWSRLGQPLHRNDDRKLQSTTTTWEKPEWFDLYRRIITKKILKKCAFLGGVPPEDGSACRKMNRPRAFGYTCMFGLAFCDSYYYGGVHPEIRCDCMMAEGEPDEGRWNCSAWVEPCIRSDTLYRSPPGSPIAWTIPPYSPDVLGGYRHRRDLEEGIKNAANFLASTIIKTDIESLSSYRDRSWGRGDDWQQFPVADSDSSSSTSLDDIKGPSAEGVNDFETHNQEEGVDEADLIKSNGEYTFAGYGDILVIWKADTGESVLNETMPPIPPSPAPSWEEEAGGRELNISPRGNYSYYYARKNPEPEILSIMLSGDRLVLVVGGYGSAIRKELGYEDILLFRDVLDTNLRVYDISKLDEGKLTLVHEEHINGRYLAARAIGDNVHVITWSSLDTWRYLSQYIRKWNPDYAGLSVGQYREKAVKIAKEVVIPKFVERVIEELSIVTGEVPDMAKISLLQSDLEGSEGIEDLIFGDGLINFFTWITSFDMSAPADETLELHEAGAFAPLTGTYTYANEDMIILAMSGWDWNRELSATGEYTFLMGFELDGPTSTPAALGSLPGLILNQFSIDFFDGHMRIATTLRAERGEVLTGSSGRPEDLRRTLNYIIVMEVAGSFKEVGRTPILGRDREVFTTVRFFNTLAYAVTFRRTDPFYVIDMKDPTMPTILGELNITGISSYLHSINDDDTLILAVGQEADKRGQVLGVQITLFDATDPTMPTALQGLTVEEKKGVFSSTSALFDFKSFRYVSLGDDFGILIMPLRISQPCCEKEGNFDGFVVYNISPDLIEERLRISHVNSQNFFGCYYKASLPQRSFVIDGNVTTLKGHSAVLTDLDSGVQMWKLDMPKPEDEEECRYWY